MAISSRPVLDSLVRALKEAAQLLGLIPPFWVRRISCRAFPAHMPGNSFLSDQSGVNVRGLRRVGTDPTGPYQEKGFHDGDLVNGPGTMQGKVPNEGTSRRTALEAAPGGVNPGQVLIEVRPQEIVPGFPLAELIICCARCHLTCLPGCADGRGSAARGDPAHSSH